MSEIRVECYAGHRADERPLRFVLRGREYLVNELDGRWYSPGASFFRVLADDGNYYVLRHDEAQDYWTLDGFRAALARKPVVENHITRADLRRHQRILVPEAVKIRVQAKEAGAQIAGLATVIGLGGVFVRTNDTPEPGCVLKLDLLGPSVSFESECTVRHVGETGIGVEFTRIEPQEEEKLKALLRRLRN
jgi:PilZ domain